MIAEIPGVLGSQSGKKQRIHSPMNMMISSPSKCYEGDKLGNDIWNIGWRVEDRLLYEGRLGKTFLRR